MHQWSPGEFAIVTHRISQPDTFRHRSKQSPSGTSTWLPAAGLPFGRGDGADGRITTTLDFSTLKMPRDFVYTERVVVIGTLECLRRVAGDKLNTTPIETKFKPKGQEATKKLVSAFYEAPQRQRVLTRMTARPMHCSHAPWRGPGMSTEGAPTSQPRATPWESEPITIKP